MKIHIPGDELIPDSELAKAWGVTRKTLWTYEKEPDGLPFWMIGKKKYRAVGASARWLAARIQQPNPRKSARREAWHAGR